MNRWDRINLALALLAATLLILHLWPAGTTGSKRLTTLDEAGISLVRVERADRLQLALQHDETGWRLTHPRQAQAETRRVQQLLAIARAPVQQEFPAGPELVRYGLEKPAAVLQLNQLRLLFGDRDLGQNNRYVLVDQRIRVIDDVYFNLLSLPASHYAGD